jgi:hypothetical protein
MITHLVIAHVQEMAEYPPLHPTLHAAISPEHGGSKASAGNDG